MLMLQNEVDGDTPKFDKRFDLANLKSDVGQLDIDRLKKSTK